MRGLSSNADGGVARARYFSRRTPLNFLAALVFFAAFFTAMKAGCLVALAERWSEDVSEDVAHELRRRCDLQMRDVPFFLQHVTDRYEGRYRDIQLPLPMRLV
jgi:hypothetical protein